MRCSGYSHVANLYYRQNPKGDPDADGAPGALPIPRIENIHARVYEAASRPGALDMSSWHCGTTHCRAGWVVELAGDAGKALERFHDTPLAAQLIIRQSSPSLTVSPVRFYESSAYALADMKAMAEREAALSGGRA